MSLHLTVLIATVLVIGYSYFLHRQLLDALELQRDWTKDALNKVRTDVGDLQDDVRKALNAGGLKISCDAKSLRRELSDLQACVKELADKIQVVSDDQMRSDVLFVRLGQDIAKLHADLRSLNGSVDKARSAE